MAAENVFHPAFAVRPYWWEAAPPGDGDGGPLSERVDVAIVGGGYCGLAAALELARAGTAVAVLEARELGYGASTRNGGLVSGGPTLRAPLAGRFGAEKAAEMMAEAEQSFVHLETLIAREGLDADYERCGRFVGAYTDGHYRQLERRAELLREQTGNAVRMVPRARQREEIGSDFYRGGMVVENAGAVHPAKYHRGLREAATRAGAGLFGQAKVRGIAREAAARRFVLDTARGLVEAREVIVATNGYTGPVTPDLRRRLVPVASYIIATEELPQALARELSPKGRVFADTKRVLYYFRLSPDGRRVLFGGRASFRDADERASAPRLFGFMCRVWPQLKSCRITHAWKGNVAMTFDHVPHMGVRDGVHYALGCNGSGVAMMTYLGHRTALKILGRENRPCAFDGLPFPTVPLYNGRPWFLPIVGGWYKLRDVLERQGHSLLALMR